MEETDMNYDVIIIGAGPGGIFAADELIQRKPETRVAVFEAGHALAKRHCPIDGDKIKSCIGCKSCSIMSGFGGAGAFSDGKYNITNDFGGTLYEYIGKKQALDLMRYVDEINLKHGGEGTKLYTTAGSQFKTLCIRNDLHLLDASVREVDLVHILHELDGLLFSNVFKQRTAKVVGDVVFAFAKRARTAKAAHDGAALAVDASLDPPAIDGAPASIQLIASLKHGHAQLRRNVA
jgi:uncharacterized FAD-dependent dehydrogenase